MNRGKCARPNCEEYKYSTAPYCRPHQLEYYEEIKLKDRFRSGNIKEFKMFKPFPAPKYYIYAIIHRFTKEIIYIGQTSQGSRRLYDHFSLRIDATTKIFCDNNLFPDERKEYYRYKILVNSTNESKEWRKYHEKELIKLHDPIMNK